MKCLEAKMKSLYKKIPVYPKFIEERKLRESVGVTYRVSFQCDMPVCEETRHNKVYYAYISEEAKEDWLKRTNS